MTKRSPCIVVGFLCCLLAGGAIAQQPEAQDMTLKAWLAARSLKCGFPVNAVTDWKSGVPKVTVGREDFTLHFDSIDVKGKTARLIGNQAAGDITAFATGGRSALLRADSLREPGSHHGLRDEIGWRLHRGGLASHRPHGRAAPEPVPRRLQDMGMKSMYRSA